MWFLIFIMFLSFQSWFWARLMIDAVYGFPRTIRFGGDHARERRVAWMIKHLPLFLGYGAFALAFEALVLSSFWKSAFMMLIIGLGFYWVQWGYQELTHPMGKSIPKGMGLCMPAKGVTQYEKLRDFPRVAHIVLAVSFAFALGATIFTVFAPDIYGEVLGSASAAFFGFAIIVPAGCLLVFWSHRCGPEAITWDRGWEPFQVSQPLLLILFLWAVIASNMFDTHTVRLAHPKDSPAPISTAERPKLPEAVKAWYDALPDNVRNSSGEIPFIIVAAAGGGSRAAYWTATVLGALEDEIPDFHRYLFAKS
jgi:hypothetical protein